MNAASPNGVTVVLVHGAWADGSSWARVIPHLLDKNIAVVAIQNPTSSLADDVAATERAMASIKGPIVLVGHSWGGTVITEAGNDPKVKGLVYVAALAPGAGESTGDLVSSHPAPPALGKIQDDGRGYLKLSPEAWIEDVANDLPASEVRILATVQPPLPTSTFGDKITKAAWQTRPSWYVVATDDRAVSVELQAELAKRLKAKTTELKASHLLILSRHREVADVIIDAVKSVTA